MNQIERSLKKQGISKNLVKKIRKITKLLIPYQSTCDLILVLLGEKFATELDLYEKYSDPPNKVRKILEEAGLIVLPKKIIEQNRVVSRSNPPTREATKSAVFCISLVEKYARKLLHLSSFKDHADYGRLMGIPETAIQAFLKDEILEMEKHDSLTKKDPMLSFFGLSKTNYKEELKLMKKWRRLLILYAPEFVKEFRRNIHKIRKKVI